MEITLERIKQREDIDPCEICSGCIFGESSRDRCGVKNDIFPCGDVDEEGNIVNYIWVEKKDEKK